MKLGVFIGRFQPFHLGHKSIIENAFKQFNLDKVLILVGSVNQPRSPRNPFTYGERFEMIDKSLFPTLKNKFIIEPIEDRPYNDQQWINDVTSLVEYVSEGFNDTVVETFLIGHQKDHSSYYLKMFPQWQSIAFPTMKTIDATTVRQEFFSQKYDWSLVNQHLATKTNLLCDKPVFNWLIEFYLNKRTEYDQIVREIEFVQSYKKQFEQLPYPPIFVTVDAVVVQSGHILLVKRRSEPGKGLWALPGGFIQQTETIEHAIFRELKEETRIDIPMNILKGSLEKIDVYDDPLRSARGRTITHAGLIRLTDKTTLPKVKGADDADKAKWVPYNEIQPSEMFEDHYHIIEHLCQIKLN